MTKPTVQFLLAHPAHFFALGFGAGLAPKAPGTFGTLVGLPLFWLIDDYSFYQQLVYIFILFIFGMYVCDKTGKDLGVADHGAIVWDEIVAIMLVLAFTPSGLFNWIIAFLLFRLFDIWKPFPIKQFDAKLKNGFGVMFDDLLAAGYAIAVILGALWLLARQLLS